MENDRFVRSGVSSLETIHPSTGRDVWLDAIVRRLRLDGVLALHHQRGAITQRRVRVFRIVLVRIRHSAARAGRRALGGTLKSPRVNRHGVETAVIVTTIASTDVWWWDGGGGYQMIFLPRTYFKT